MATNKQSLDSQRSYVSSISSHRNNYSPQRQNYLSRNRKSNNIMNESKASNSFLNNSRLSNSQSNFSSTPLKIVKKTINSSQQIPTNVHELVMETFKHSSIKDVFTKQQSQIELSKKSSYVLNRESENKFMQYLSYSGKKGIKFLSNIIQQKLIDVGKSVKLSLSKKENDEQIQKKDEKKKGKLIKFDIQGNDSNELGDNINLNHLNISQKDQHNNYNNNNKNCQQSCPFIFDYIPEKQPKPKTEQISLKKGIIPHEQIIVQLPRQEFMLQKRQQQNNSMLQYSLSDEQSYNQLSQQQEQEQEEKSQSQQQKQIILDKELQWMKNIQPKLSSKVERKLHKRNMSNYFRTLEAEILQKNKNQSSLESQQNEVQQQCGPRKRRKILKENQEIKQNKCSIQFKEASLKIKSNKASNQQTLQTIDKQQSNKSIHEQNVRQLNELQAKIKNNKEVLLTRRTSSVSKFQEFRPLRRQEKKTYDTIQIIEFMKKSVYTQRYEKAKNIREQLQAEEREAMKLKQIQNNGAKQNENKEREQPSLFSLNNQIGSESLNSQVRFGLTPPKIFQNSFSKNNNADKSQLEAQQKNNTEKEQSAKIGNIFSTNSQIGGNTLFSGNFFNNQSNKQKISNQNNKANENSQQQKNDKQKQQQEKSDLKQPLNKQQQENNKQEQKIDTNKQSKQNAQNSQNKQSSNKDSDKKVNPIVNNPFLAVGPTKGLVLANIIQKHSSSNNSFFSNMKSNKQQKPKSPQRQVVQQVFSTPTRNIQDKLEAKKNSNTPLNLPFLGGISPSKSKKQSSYQKDVNNDSFMFDESQQPSQSYNPNNSIQGIPSSDLYDNNNISGQSVSNPMNPPFNPQGKPLSVLRHHLQSNSFGEGKSFLDGCSQNHQLSSAPPPLLPKPQFSFFNNSMDAALLFSQSSNSQSAQVSLFGPSINQMQKNSKNNSSFDRSERRRNKKNREQRIFN